MTAANEHRYGTDGATGTQLQAADLTLDACNNDVAAVETKYVQPQSR
nr:hypothetical protein [Mycobacterium sp. 852002-10029_SCH5224772]